GWDIPRPDDHNFLRTVLGQKANLDKQAQASGALELTDAEAHWWILKEDEGTGHGRWASTGHIAALYQDELYEMLTGRAGVARLQSFGIIFGHDRVVIYVEPTNGGRSRLS